MGEIPVGDGAALELHLTRVHPDLPELLPQDLGQERTRLRGLCSGRCSCLQPHIPAGAGHCWGQSGLG